MDLVKIRQEIIDGVELGVGNYITVTSTTGEVTGLFARVHAVATGTTLKAEGYQSGGYYAGANYTAGTALSADESKTGYIAGLFSKITVTGGMIRVLKLRDAV